MNLDKRIEKNITSIINLKNLLIAVINNTPDYLKDNLLLEALLSQDKLSKYKNEELSIYTTSINTMKRLSSYPNCDFESLNKLRVLALEKVQNQNLTKDKINYNKKDLLEKIENLENELNINKNSQLLLLRTINEINKTFKSIKNISNAEEIKEHINLMSNKIKQVMSLDTSFLMNGEESNVITHDFRKKELT